MSSTPTKPPTTEKNKTSLGKRKKSELSICNTEDSEDIDRVISEPITKIQKVTHSNTVDEESVEKKKSEILEPSFVQTKTEMTCVCGNEHTITLSNDGTVYSFGRNNKGQLGLRLGLKRVSVPTPIPNLPKIKMISCGGCFTVCVDYEGFIWSFGNNDYGKLGIGNNIRNLINYRDPQKILEIPPVLSVSCGCDYILIITNDDNLWSSMISDNYVMETQNIAQSLKKHHFQT